MKLTYYVSVVPIIPTCPTSFIRKPLTDYPLTAMAALPSGSVRPVSVETSNIQQSAEHFHPKHYIEISRRGRDGPGCGCATGLSDKDQDRRRHRPGRTNRPIRMEILWNTSQRCCQQKLVATICMIRPQRPLACPGAPPAVLVWLATR